MEPKLDFRTIRHLNGGPEEAFEELCCQLARSEYPRGFVRKGTPDGGVECFAELVEGRIIAWQAKYFFELGSAEFSQIEKSVLSALDSHPELATYVICVPYNRPDSGSTSGTTALKRWYRHVEKWKAEAARRGMNVNFEYWGFSELVERLAIPSQAGRVRFWFDKLRFDIDWFNEKLKTAIKTVGPRYTAELNVNLPIGQHFEYNLQTPSALDTLKRKAKTIKDACYLRAIDNIDLPQEDKTLTLVLHQLVETYLEFIETLTFCPDQPDISEDLTTARSQAVERANELDARLVARLEEEREKDIERNPFGPSQSPLEELTTRNRRLLNVLYDDGEVIDRALALWSANLVLLEGNGGTGKTHLLCDLASRQLARNRPSILILGKQLGDNSTPWEQILSLLDLKGYSAEEFVTAMEAAAQAYNCQFAFMIDALNEGNGRTLWPHHIHLFLQPLLDSKWITTILSIRSNYKETVIPTIDQEDHFPIVHWGFTGEEYNATLEFFSFYGIELPSTPLLAPEFSNPLFLKVLCKGLNSAKEKRLPRGFHGVTGIFDMYLSAINKKLSEELAYDSKADLVEQSLKLLIREGLKSQKHLIERARARELVDSLLPGRDFPSSLFAGLINEGVLFEDIVQQQGRIKHVVTIAFERLQDHFTAKTLIDEHVSLDYSDVAFASGGLSFLTDQGFYMTYGLLEALSIQIPEVCGKELYNLHEFCREHFQIGAAFRSSIMWRSIDAFSDETRELISMHISSQFEAGEWVDCMITVATIPDHPYNAERLDSWLHKLVMPQRDRLWSIALHRGSYGKGASHRLFDWALRIKESTHVEDETLNLAAITLMWMTTTPNRFVRDRATKSLVALLTGRHEALSNLIKRFRSVDDAYVKQRLYAVAYGVSMRSSSPVGIGLIADTVYESVFAAGTPPVDILLRDYARGLCERALYLGHLIPEPNLIRPPYGSRWRAIPTASEYRKLKQLLASGPKRATRSGAEEIISSVEYGDFARYIIGTNSKWSAFLYVSVRKPLWVSPGYKIDLILDSLTTEQKHAWEILSQRMDPVTVLIQNMIGKLVEAFSKEEKEKLASLSDADLLEQYRTMGPWTAKDREKDFIIASEETLRLEKLFSSKVLSRLRLLDQRRYEHQREPRRFNLEWVQRLVLKRVYELGYSEELFGDFDRGVAKFSYDRESRKPERIGKKYQWIAFHEIMARVADNFQYCPSFSGGTATIFQGPWQENFRDIDPSCTISSFPEREADSVASSQWWVQASFSSWSPTTTANQWVAQTNDLPHSQDILVVLDPQSNTRWINLSPYFFWEMPKSPLKDYGEVEQRSLRLGGEAFLILSSDVEKLVNWFQTSDGVEDIWLQKPREYKLFLGEHGWSPASQEVSRTYDDGEISPLRDLGLATDFRMATISYVEEAAGFDCSVDSSFQLNLPSAYLVRELNLRWSGDRAAWIAPDETVVAFDPREFQNDFEALLIRQESVLELCKVKGLSLCWIVSIDRSVTPGGYNRKGQAYTNIVRLFILDKEGGMLMRERTKSVFDRSGD